MVSSMTGFATASIAFPSGGTSVSATLTLKTLNGRFLDVSCKLPYGLMHLEADMVKLCKSTLQRGTVYFTFHLNNMQSLKTNIMPSVSVAQGYISAIQLLQKQCNIPGQVTISDLIPLPNLFEAIEDVITPAATALIMREFERLVSLVVVARTQEGATLSADLQARMRIISKNMEIIQPRVDEINERRKQQFIALIHEALATATVPAQEHHMQSLYSNIDKVDIHEEIVRFQAHTDNFLVTLADNSTEKGKKLDFILQEMFREINTLNAKFPDAALSNAILTIKVELEKAREQVQNIT